MPGDCFCIREVPLTLERSGHHVPGQRPGRISLGESAVDDEGLIEPLHSSVKRRDLHPLLRTQIVLLAQHGQTINDLLLPTPVLPQSTPQQIQFHRVRSGMRDFRELAMKIGKLSPSPILQQASGVSQTRPKISREY